MMSIEMIIMQIMVLGVVGFCMSMTIYTMEQKLKL